MILDHAAHLSLFLSLGFKFYSEAFIRVEVCGGAAYGVGSVSGENQVWMRRLGDSHCQQGDRRDGAWPFESCFVWLWRHLCIRRRSLFHLDNSGQDV